MSIVNFQTDVLQASFQRPVVVDFWAPWCGPCRMLGPVLEQLAQEQSDRWTLVKINSDEEQELAAQFKVMSIPNVKMFHQGKVVGEFAGALSRSAILQWLDQHIPDPAKDGLQNILNRLDAGDISSLAALESLVQARPDLLEARLALASRIAFSHPEQAMQLVADIHLGNEHFDTAEDIRTLTRWAQCSCEDAPHGELLSESAKLAAAGNWEKAVVRLIEAVGIDKSYADDLPRKAAIAVFRTLGPQHPVTRAWRRKFDMALY